MGSEQTMTIEQLQPEEHRHPGVSVQPLPDGGPTPTQSPHTIPHGSVICHRHTKIQQVRLSSTSYNFTMESTRKLPI